MENNQSEGGYHATTTVTTQVSTQNLVQSEPQPGSFGNLNVTELLAVRLYQATAGVGAAA
jgi:hypothetical protein